MSRIEPTDAERSEITRQVIDVGTDHDVWIHRAVDVGSRARGLASERSDYDVFAVFSQPCPDYVVEPTYRGTFEETIEAAETSLDAEIEIQAWNIRKFVGGEDFHGNNGGILGSDPMACEFVASDRVYYTSPCTDRPWDRLDEHVTDQFKPYQLIAHYRSFARKNYRKYLSGDDDTTVDVTVKRYLNVCQALCKRQYIEKTQEMPPMDASELLRTRAHVLPREVYATIGDLIVRKRDGRGTDEPTDDTRETLDAWIEDECDWTVPPRDELTDRSPDPSVVRSCVGECMEERNR